MVMSGGQPTGPQRYPLSFCVVALKDASVPAMLSELRATVVLGEVPKTNVSRRRVPRKACKNFAIVIDVCWPLSGSYWF